MEPTSDSNIVKTLLFIPRRYEKYRYYVNTNFQQPRAIPRDEIGRFVLPYLKDSATYTKLLDWLQAHKTFFVDTDTGSVLELADDYTANMKAIQEVMKANQLSDALADKEAQKQAIRQRTPIPFEDKAESIVDKVYKKVLGYNRKDNE